MKNDLKFIRFAALCCLVSVVTTLGIHLFFSDFPTEFTERLYLFKNKTYLLLRWWVIFHVLLVLISMWGCFLVMRQFSLAWSGLGMICFTIFSFTEMWRQFLVLFYLNGLRARYLDPVNENIREIIKVSMDQFGLISISLFALFILAFAFGNLCYGIALWKKSGFDKILSGLFLFWSIGNFAALSIEFLPNPGLESILGVYNYTYQPMIRLIIGLWLWQKSTG